MDGDVWILVHHIKENRMDGNGDILLQIYIVGFMNLIVIV